MTVVMCTIGMHYVKNKKSTVDNSTTILSEYVRAAIIDSIGSKTSCSCYYCMVHPYTSLYTPSF